MNGDGSVTETVIELGTETDRERERGDSRIAFCWTLERSKERTIGKPERDHGICLLRTGSWEGHRDEDCRVPAQKAGWESRAK
jgi:hypothetical protein